MRSGRTLLLAVDGLAPEDAAPLREAARVPAMAGELTVRPGGPSEPAPALASVLTGTTVARTHVASEMPFLPGAPGVVSAWYASALTAPTLLDAAEGEGAVTAALQWPATAGAGVSLCLPLVEDVRHYRNRWEMAESTSSPRMVAEHLAPRREAGVQLSQVPPDALVAEIAAEVLTRSPVGLAAVRLTGLARARREDGIGSPAVRRALADLLDAVAQIAAAFGAGRDDRTVLVPGRPLVPTVLLVHPNTALAARGLIRTDGPRLASFRALVWPDGPRGALHVRREEGEAVRRLALDVLGELAEHHHLTLREVDDGVGATGQTDVIAVLEGAPGTVVGLSPTNRPLVDGDDPYYAGPRAVTDPSAVSTALLAGPGLPTSPVEGSWADLGATLAAALDLPLPAATGRALRSPAPA
ncbi:phosphodiesterase [Brachybacterium sp. SGAir0954]|uniref:phosphodiesterase n=1 Tax=Brachybacterium sp. SGAir0954 TaxID=2571029 RepID=UPI0010CD3E3D|nr:phosphodiesterase [Brachybacterium sp. SGAir0954]QCR54857.1 phosphodiesterase [Brachybacterium sp. SGAir0954]